MKYRIQKHLLIIFCIFGLVYSSISLVNHYLFRTAILDLGLLNQFLHHLSAFQKEHVTFYYNGQHLSYWGDHFSPIIILFIPFKFVFGSYTLLFAQIASILYGGYGIYKFCLLRLNGNILKASILLIHFLSIWGIYSALSFDFHTNVIGAMLVPWLFYYYELKNKWKFTILLLLILMCKENMALWGIFIMLGFILANFKSNFNSKLKFELSLLFMTIIYFVVIVKFVIPYFNGSSNTAQLSWYSEYGNSFSDIIKYIVKHPIQIIDRMFKSQLSEPLYKDIKMEFHLMTLFSGGIALLINPKYLLMLIPIYLQKMLPDNHVFWGINAHYSIEIVPIISIALIELVRKIKNTKWQTYVFAFTTLSTISATIITMEGRKSIWYDEKNTVFYKKLHYDSDLNSCSK